MSNIALKGHVTFEVLNQEGEIVQSSSFYNLITSYGLEQLFKPVELKESVVTHISVGYSGTEPNVQDLVVPSSFKSSNVVLRSNNFDNYIINHGDKSLNTVIYRTTFKNSLFTENEKIDRIHLSQLQEDGSYKALTSVNLLDQNGVKTVYTHSVSNYVRITYRLYIELDVLQQHLYNTASIQFVSGVQSIDNLEKEIYKDKSYVNLERGSYAKVLYKTHEYKSDGSLEYTYILKHSSQISFKLGIGQFLITVPRTYTKDIELKFTVSQYSPEHLLPGSVEVVEQDSNSKTFKLKGKPNQFVKFNLPMSYSSEADTIVSYRTVFAYIDETGYSPKIYYALRDEKAHTYTNIKEISSGKPIKFTALDNTGNNEKSSFIQLQDAYAEDVRNIYFINKNTIRVVSVLNDEISVYKNETHNSDSLLGVGTCTIPSEEYEGYYYTDINLGEDFNIEYVINPTYTNKDASGNIYNSTNRSTKRSIYVYGIENVTGKEVENIHDFHKHSNTSRGFGPNHNVICYKAEILE